MAENLEKVQKQISKFLSYDEASKTADSLTYTIKNRLVEIASEKRSQFSAPPSSSFSSSLKTKSLRGSAFLPKLEESSMNSSISSRASSRGADIGRSLHSSNQSSREISKNTHFNTQKPAKTAFSAEEIVNMTAGAMWGNEGPKDVVPPVYAADYRSVVRAGALQEFNRLGNGRSITVE